MSAAAPDQAAAVPTLAQLHSAARARLQEAGIAEGPLDARLLVEHVTGTTRKDLMLHPDRPAAAEAAIRLQQALARRLAGEPTHRIIGSREFYGLPFRLSAETLEPRPDTEALVELVLPFVRKTVAARGACRILDLGTGTGAIGLALLAAAPAATALLTDISADALATAQGNARTLGLSDRAEFQLSNWFEKITGRFDAIVSNPPYIRSSDIASLQPEVRNFDPPRALDGGKDGLDAYRAIAHYAGSRLKPAGVVAVEVGHNQRNDAAAVFGLAGFRVKTAQRDLGGHERALLFTLAGAAQKTLGIADECR